MNAIGAPPPPLRCVTLHPLSRPPQPLRVHSVRTRESAQRHRALAPRAQHARCRRLRSSAFESGQQPTGCSCACPRVSLAPRSLDLPIRPALQRTDTYDPEINPTYAEAQDSSTGSTSTDSSLILIQATAVSDDEWQSLLPTLIAGVDVIILDLSLLSANLLREIEVCVALAPRKQILFIAHSDVPVDWYGLAKRFPQLASGMGDLLKPLRYGGWSVVFRLRLSTPSATGETVRIRAPSIDARNAVNRSLR